MKKKTEEQEYREELASTLRKLRSRNKKSEAVDVLRRQQKTRMYQRAKSIHKGVQKGIVRILSSREQQTAPEQIEVFPIIIARSPEGEEITFNTREEHEKWIQFYRGHNLSELVVSEEGETYIPGEIRLSHSQIAKIQELVEQYGFDHMMICPANSVQLKILPRVKKEMGRSLTHLTEQYSLSHDGIYLCDGVRKALREKKIIQERQERPYICLWKDTMEVDVKGMSGRQLETECKRDMTRGETLFEYFIRQRYQVEHRGEHPDTENWTWLVDTRRQGDDPQSVSHEKDLFLRAEWSPGQGVVIIGEEDPDYSDSQGGVRRSGIFYLSV